MESNNTSPADQAKEKQKWINKYFDLVENPIKEWIAEYFGEPIESIFDDYKVESDIMATEENGQHYFLYATSFPDITENSITAFPIGRKELEKCPKLSKATSVIFDAVYTVFPPVVHTMQKFKDAMMNISIKFNQDIMAFEFTTNNILAREKNNAMQNIYICKNQIEKINSDAEFRHKNPNYEEIKSEIEKKLNENIVKYNSISDISIKEQEKLCELLEKKLEKAPKFYIVLEKNSRPDDDHIMKRLPDIGSKYYDPEEESITEKLKKELSIK